MASRTALLVSLVRRVACCVTLAACSVASQAQGAGPAEVIDFSALKPFCNKPFKIKADASGCEADAEAFKELTEKSCKATEGAEWKDSKCVAAADAKKFPVPVCGSRLPDLAYNADKRSCQVVRQTPRSSLGDFVGDCFKIQAPPPDLPDGSDDGFRAGQYWLVESQRRLPDEDKELVVSPASVTRLFNWTLWCSATGERERRLRASRLIESGAHRYGWSYGVLTLPFKYHSSDKSFTPGAINVGPFLGRRWGSAGSSVTAAISATVGSVRGEVVDAQGLVIETPDLTAFSVAVGVMFDVSKNPDLKPFKVGLFWGNDRVNGRDAVKYRYNRKPWIAFQIGYDFTDTK